MLELFVLFVLCRDGILSLKYLRGDDVTSIFLNGGEGDFFLRGEVTGTSESLLESESKLTLLLPISYPLPNNLGAFTGGEGDFFLEGLTGTSESLSLSESKLTLLLPISYPFPNNLGAFTGGEGDFFLEGLTGTSESLSESKLTLLLPIS